MPWVACWRRNSQWHSTELRIFPGLLNHFQLKSNAVRNSIRLYTVYSWYISQLSPQFHNKNLTNSLRDIYILYALLYSNMIFYICLNVPLRVNHDQVETKRLPEMFGWPEHNPWCVRLLRRLLTMWLSSLLQRWVYRHFPKPIKRKRKQWHRSIWSDRGLHERGQAWSRTIALNIKKLQ